MAFVSDLAAAPVSVHFWSLSEERSRQLLVHRSLVLPDCMQVLRHPDKSGGGIHHFPVDPGRLPLPSESWTTSFLLPGWRCLSFRLDFSLLLPIHLRTIATLPKIFNLRLWFRRTITGGSVITLMKLRQSRVNCPWLPWVFIRPNARSTPEGFPILQILIVSSKDHLSGRSPIGIGWFPVCR